MNSSENKENIPPSQSTFDPPADRPAVAPGPRLPAPRDVRAADFGRGGPSRTQGVAATLAPGPAAARPIPTQIAAAMPAPDPPAAPPAPRQVALTTRTSSRLARASAAEPLVTTASELEATGSDKIEAIDNKKSEVTSNKKSKATSAEKPNSTGNKKSTKKTGTKPTAVKVYQQRKHNKDSTAKHAPISNRGYRIMRRDNPGLDPTPFKKNVRQPEKMEVQLIDIKGNIHRRFFPGKDEEKWDDQAWISAANNWRNQTLRRMLKHDQGYYARGIRPNWGMREARSLQFDVAEKVKNVGYRRLTTLEWEEITKIHNERFAGTKIRTGERLANGKVIKTGVEIKARTLVAVKALFDRNEDMKAFYRGLTGYSDNNVAESHGVERDGVVSGAEDVEMRDGGDASPEEGKEDESTSDKESEIYGGDIDPRLEDPSDDEEDGQRPASTQNGAQLIACV